MRLHCKYCNRRLAVTGNPPKSDTLQIKAERGGSAAPCKIHPGEPPQAVFSLVGTPFSDSKPCSSWFWNISRMMSQPPTNSPFT